MILVAVGASEFPFDRLLRAIDKLPTREPVVVQHGPSEVCPAHAHCIPFVPQETLAQLVREARVVVTHAGVGSILLSLTNGKRPCVVPRLGRFGETVDDHQLESARKFAQAGLVTLVENPDHLGDAIAVAETDPILPPLGEGRLVGELRIYLDAVIARRRSRAAR
jgi:UDP-N-acetylglucosamine transferase subunit ALG13